MSPSVVPATRPEIARETVLGWVRALGREPESLCIVGRRGYYRDTMGTVGVQERGIYDDSITVVSPRVCVSFNANVDPSAAPLAKPGVAVLEPGRHLYRIGIHNRSKAPERQYPALEATDVFWVKRDGSAVATKDGVKLNIHKGGYNVTSSEGCQTIYPDQWNAFFALVTTEAELEGVTTIPYYLSARDAG